MHNYEAQSAKSLSNIQAYTLRQPHYTYQPDQFLQQERQVQYQYLRSNKGNSDDAQMHENTSGKRRPSRGNRCVNTLTEAQLERKRANDREAQRAIRQRTKEQIESLQKRVAELSVHEGACDELIATTQRNKELEEENLLLRSKLNQAVDTLRRCESADPVLSPPISISGDVYNSNQSDPSLRNFYQHRSSSTSTVASAASTTAAAVVSQVSPSTGRSNDWNLTSFQNQMPSLNPQRNQDNCNSRLSPSPKHVSYEKGQDMGLSWTIRQDTNRSQSLSNIYNAATQRNHVNFWASGSEQQTAEYSTASAVTASIDRSMLHDTSPASGGRVFAPETVSDESCLSPDITIGYNNSKHLHQQQQQQQQEQQQASLKYQGQHPRFGSTDAVEVIGSYNMLNGCEGFRPTATASSSSAQHGVVTTGSMPVGGLKGRQYLYDMAVQLQH